MKSTEINLAGDKTACCGCGMCTDVCHKNAIRMEMDDYGFLYPVIDSELCVNCGRCLKYCAFKKSNNGNPPIEVFAAAGNEQLIQHSASGGIFSTLALNLLRNGGMIAGCTMEYTDCLTPMHTIIDQENMLVKCQGSKYVQSETTGIFQKVKEALELKKKVLFSGTPCQIDALKSYIDTEKYPNLYTVDIICHGVPSIKMFQDYIAILSETVGGTITDICFRDKTNGWGYRGFVQYRKKNGKENKKIIPVNTSSYYKLFLKSEICRESCYHCPYACQKRAGDLTIGDYWGIETEHPEYLQNHQLDIEKGISCILVNSERGQQLLSKYGDTIKKYPSVFEKVAKHNAQLNRPSIMGKHRKTILTLYKQYGYAEIEQWYKKKLGIKRVVYFFWNKIPPKMQKKLKK